MLGGIDWCCLALTHANADLQGMEKEGVRVGDNKCDEKRDAVLSRAYNVLIVVRS